MPREKRSRASIAEAVRRVAAECFVPVELIDTPFAWHPGRPEHLVPARTLQRWIVSGCRGVYLDGFHRPGLGWVTSPAALERFRAALAAATAPAPELAKGSAA